jgi:6-phosphofructokinase 1
MLSRSPRKLEMTATNSIGAKPGSFAPRVCLVSGGGDAPGVNAIVRAFVHASRHFGIEVIGSRYGFEGFLDPKGLVPISVADVRGILPKGGCILGCSTRINPFYMPSKGGHTEDVSPAIADRLKSSGIDTLVMIGGDGTTIAASRFAKLGLHCIAVPKTIDNDLAQTDRTCGSESAVETATHAIDALHSTAEAHSRVMLVEVMGRNAGFIALHAGVAGGADVILIPEIPYRLDRIIAKIRERESLGLRFSIVVIAEGAKPIAGDASEIESATPGHLARLGGAGARLMRQLEDADLDHEIRLTVLGHLQRGGSPCPSDRNLGTQLGAFAAELCRQGGSSCRLVIQGSKVTSVPLDFDEGTLNQKVDLTGSLVRAAQLIGIELGGTVNVAQAKARK